MANKRSFISSIGLLLSFIGMTGLVLSILSLLPLNGYNIYTTVITGTHLLQFELQKTHGDWKHLELSSDAKIYMIFLAGSLFSSLFEIILTFTACCRHQTKPEKFQGVTTMIQPPTVAAAAAAAAEEVVVVVERENDDFSNNHHQKQQQHDYTNKVVNRKSWFLRITCFTLLIQIIFSLFGTHIIYKMKSDIDTIPIEIQQNTSISCAILWINYLSLTLFSILLLFASFFLLIGAYHKQHKHNHLSQNEETIPLIL